MTEQGLQTSKDFLLEIKDIKDLKDGKLPGYFYPKLIELGEFKLEPFDEISLTNICYYLHFNNMFRRPKPGADVIDLSSKDSIDDSCFPYEQSNSYVLYPGKSVIAQTFEKVGLSNWLIGKLENTTQLGRFFVNHSSHGYIHPGHGINNPFQLMIELTNLGERPVELKAAEVNKGKVIGPEAFRLFIEKLPYPTLDYKELSFVPKLKMNIEDKS